MASLIKKITIDIYDDGNTVVKEENIGGNINFIEEDVNITNSWMKYNLITFKKNGLIYNELQKFLPNQEITVELEGAGFKGKIDKNGVARIYSLSALYNYADTNNIEMKLGKIANLKLDTKNKILKIIL
ncbi:hypothetical protein [Clostridium botulinum]|uniref:hypothetical protein n=1 Tax=Clostridium botulinum TaxID=1491 RepID=UPI0019687F6D|nr:hypothetical protein [Clostridium botulinum]MBN1064156.1 hypothetical protein [Clostridium botulinum]